MHRVSVTGAFSAGGTGLKTSGVQKQNANPNPMIWSVPEQIAKLSEAFVRMPGDIIFSGAPENFGPENVGPGRPGRA